MSTTTILGIALIVAGATDAVIGVVLGARQADPQRGRILRIALTTGGALLVAMGLVFLLR